MMAIPISMPEQPKIAETGVMTDADGTHWVLRPGASWWEPVEPEEAATFAEQQYRKGHSK